MTTHFFFSVFHFLSPGSLLPNHSDAPLWKGLQNVQQDFSIPRVRYHRSSWRQWVVDIIFSNMSPTWVLTDQLSDQITHTFVTFITEIWLRCHCCSAQMNDYWQNKAVCFLFLQLQENAEFAEAWLSTSVETVMRTEILPLARSNNSVKSAIYR